MFRFIVNVTSRYKLIFFYGSEEEIKKGTTSIPKYNNFWVDETYHSLFSTYISRPIKSCYVLRESEAMFRFQIFSSNF